MAKWIVHRWSHGKRDKGRIVTAETARDALIAACPDIDPAQIPRPDRHGDILDSDYYSAALVAGM